MTVIRQIPVSPATLQTLAGQTSQPSQAAAAPQAVAALQAILSEQTATLVSILQQALGEAAPRQGGLASLMADAEGMLAQNGSVLPANVKAALQDVLATRLAGQGAVDATKLQAAVKQSGAFLESALAKGQPVQGDLKAALLGLRQSLQTWLGVQSADAAVKTASLPNLTASAAAPGPALPQAQQAVMPATQPLAPAATLPPHISPAASAASTPLRDAALRLLVETDAMIERPIAQPLATTDTPLKANLEAMLARKDSPLPQAVREAIQTVLGQRPAAPPHGDALKSQTALPPASLTGEANAVPAGGDMKIALLGLRQALQNWLAPKTDIPLPQPQAASPQPAHAPPPPLRSGPTVPQPPVRAAGLDMLPLRDAGLRLLAETDAALARNTMLQIASLPDDPSAPRSAENAQRLVLDIPLVTPQGTAIVQLRIERDQKRSGRDRKAPVWQATFSIDVEPIGPVHARVAMVGDTANVALFAERPDSAAALRANSALLAAGLAEAAVEPGDILCATGAPAAPAAAPGLFVDRAS